MQATILEVREKDLEYIFRFSVDELHRFRLAVPKSALIGTQSEVVATTISGSLISFRLLIKDKKNLKIIEVNPSTFDCDHVWKLRHEAAPHKNDD